MHLVCYTLFLKYTTIRNVCFTIVWNSIYICLIIQLLIKKSKFCLIFIYSLSFDQKNFPVIYIINLSKKKCYACFWFPSVLCQNCPFPCLATFNLISIYGVQLSLNLIKVVNLPTPDNG